MSKYIIEVKNISKKFQDHTVLKDVSVNFQSGKIYGIIGRNGSGKTVLFKSICGFFSVTSGEIVVNNKIVGKEIDIPSDLGILISSFFPL